MQTKVGYTGGTNPNPTYQSVCDGDGHTEAIRIEYDESQTSYDELLDFFWKNYHGSSHFTQYKAAIWVHDEEQQVSVLRSIEAAPAAKGPRDAGPRSKLEVLNASSWHDAEEYHQKYILKSSQQRMPTGKGGSRKW